MKSFWIALLLLFLMLGGILLNAHGINRIVLEMEARLDQLPSIDDPTCTAEAQALLEAWERQVGRVSLSVSFPVFDRVSEQAALLYAAALAKDPYGYRAATVLLYDALEDMRRLETYKAFV